MSRLRILATIIVVALAGAAIWYAGTGMRPGRTVTGKSASPDSAYDYQATDVVVTQLGPDGSLQYELTAKKITQEPRNGQILAQDLLMHRDPPGSPPGGPNRMTVRADRAVLPEPGGPLTLEGNVHGEGRPQNSRAPFVLDTEQLVYNLVTEDVSSNKLVAVTWGESRMNVQGLHMNIRTGDFKTDAIKVDSAYGTRAPK